MFSLSEVPFLRMVLPFAAGILISRHFQIPHSVFCSIAFTLVMAYAVLLFNRKLNTYRTRWLPGLIIHLFLVSGGWMLGLLHHEIDRPLHFSKFIKPSSIYSATITNKKKPGEKTNRYVAEIKHLFQNNNSLPVTGKVMVYTNLDTKLRYGDELLFMENPIPVNGPMNPGEFDYKKFLERKNIYHSIYLKPGDYLLSKKNNGNPLLRLSIEVRDQLLEILSRYLEGNERAVVSALLLGYEEGLDNDLLGAYSEAGVIHVLSVSGFHVMIIYLVFNFILGFLKRLKAGKYVIAVLLPGLIWSYALVSGFSPPVIRASLMISFLILGKTFREDSHPMNLLCLSAFLILLYDANMLYDLGFQLSFLAVAGIVVLYPLLYELYIPRYSIVDKIWGMACVSVAAQAATLPLSVYYFHTIPVYFLLANLLIVPASTLLIYCGMFLFLSSFLQPLDFIAEKIVWGIAAALNYSVDFIAALPGAVIGQVTFSLLQCLLLYGLLFLVISWALNKKNILPVAGLLVLFLFLVEEALELNFQLTLKTVVVHHSKQGGEIQFADGRNFFLLGPTPHSQAYTVKPFYEKNGGENLVTVNRPFFQSENLLVNRSVIRFFDLHILKISSRDDILPYPMDFDLVILEKSKNEKGFFIDLKKIKESVRFEKIIFGPTIRGKILEALKRSAVEMGMDYYSVAESGAFVYSVKGNSEKS